jgi:hypothetical protein
MQKAARILAITSNNSSDRKAVINSAGRRGQREPSPEQEGTKTMSDEIVLEQGVLLQLMLLEGRDLIVKIDGKVEKDPCGAWTIPVRSKGDELHILRVRPDSMLELEHGDGSITSVLKMSEIGFSFS